MKKKRILIIVITFIIVISGYLTIRNFTESTNGKVDIEIAVNLQVDKLLNPQSVNGKSIKEIREISNKQATKWSKEPIPFSNIKDININVSYGKIPVRIYTPGSSKQYPVIIYSHGGSWVSGSYYAYDNVCRKLSQDSKAIVIAVDYRLAPEHPFPSAITDVYNVLLWSNSNAKSINGDGSKIALAGDSAGGNISAAISQMSRDKNGPHITCQVLIYPATNIYELNTKSWSDFAKGYVLTKENSEKFISMYVPKKEDRKNPYASPLLANKFDHLPDTLVITAEIDPLRDEGEAYAEKLKKAGIQVNTTRYNGVPHGFVSMDKITDKADKAINEITVYLRNKFNLENKLSY